MSLSDNWCCLRILCYFQCTNNTLNWQWPTPMQSTYYFVCFLSFWLSHCLSFCLSVCLSVCLLSVCRSDLCLSVCLYFGLSLHLSRCLSLYVCQSMSVSLHVVPSVRSFWLIVGQSVSQSVCLSLCLSVCLSTKPPFTHCFRRHNMEMDNVTTLYCYSYVLRDL
jgi:hypothetical protein